MLEILKTLKDTPLPIVLVIGGLIFLLIPFIQKISSKEVGIETTNQSFAGLIGFVLLVTGIGLYVIPSGTAASPTVIPPIITSVTSEPTNAFQAQPTAIIASPNQQSAPTQQVFSTVTPSLEFVYREATGGYVTKKYNITLGDGEVIVGQGYGFQQYTGCVAYIIKGAGQFSFSVTDGAWLYFKNVTSTDQAELLLQNQVDSLNQQNCPPKNIIRLP